MRQLIESAIATRPAGLVVSLPNPTALAPAIHAAERAGIPIIAINAGSDAFRKLGILLYVGEDEYQAGLAAGDRMRTRGVRHALCVIHEADNLALQQRCSGFAAALAQVGGHSTVLEVNSRTRLQSKNESRPRWKAITSTAYSLLEEPPSQTDAGRASRRSPAREAPLRDIRSRPAGPASRSCRADPFRC